MGAGRAPASSCELLRPSAGTLRPSAGTCEPLRGLTGRGWGAPASYSQEFSPSDQCAVPGGHAFRWS
jgi:hypothetical protein